MYHKALSIYYTLTLFLVGTAALVMYPTNQSELAMVQNSLKQQFKVAFIQTVGDQPWFEDFGNVYDGISSFYNQSANTTIAMLSDPETDSDIIYVYGQVYRTFASALNLHPASPVTGIAYDQIDLPKVASSTFMTEEPIYNIIPQDTYQVTRNLYQEKVAGATTVSSEVPVNTQTPWVTVMDNMTGQLYCLAVYDGAVNKYDGPCKSGYY